MRFILNPDRNVFSDNPTLKMTEHLSKLTNKEVKWIALVYDYESPLAQMPLNLRKIKAAQMTGWNIESNIPLGDTKLMIDGKNARINKAVAEYKSIQFDENQESLLAFNEQLKEYRAFLKQKQKKPSELKIAMALQKEMPALLKARDEIAKLVGLRAHDEEFEITDIENISTMDKIIFEEEQLKDNAH